MSSSLLRAATGGLLALMIAFALASVPGAIIGYITLKALRGPGAL